MPPETATALRRLASAHDALPYDPEISGSKLQILTGALTLFAEKNFAGASVRDVAAACGLKPASLYAHYKSKEEILATLVGIGHSEHHRRITDALAASEESAAAQLQAWVSAHIRFHATYPMLSTVINHELHAVSMERIADSIAQREDCVNRLLGILEKGEQGREFLIGHDVWLAAAAIGGMGMRVAHWFNEEQSYGVEELVDSYCEFALRIAGSMPRSVEQR